ncbi:hypothetical protein DFH27DRAFT_597108 [Peziza echinospora]|nr:hypothetical protein DFH27DRAFT_597108 [Peziza echinospora]
MARINLRSGCAIVASYREQHWSTGFMGDLGAKTAAGVCDVCRGKNKGAGKDTIHDGIVEKYPYSSAKPFSNSQTLTWVDGSWDIDEVYDQPDKLSQAPDWSCGNEWAAFWSGFLQGEMEEQLEEELRIHSDFKVIWLANATGNVESPEIAKVYISGNGACFTYRRNGGVLKSLWKAYFLSLYMLPNFQGSFARGLRLNQMYHLNQRRKAIGGWFFVDFLLNKDDI